MNEFKSAKQTNEIDRIQSFDGTALEAFVMESASPFLKSLHEKTNQLNALVSKRDDLRDELKGLEIQPPKLDENSLLQTSVSEHAAAIKNYQKIIDRQVPVKDLFSQVSQAIDKLKKEIAEEQKTFAGIVTDAIQRNTFQARSDFAVYLKVIIEKDQEYVQYVNQLFKIMAAEANKGIGASTPLEPIEFMNRYFRGIDARLIQDTALMKDIESAIRKISFNP